MRSENFHLRPMTGLCKYGHLYIAKILAIECTRKLASLGITIVIIIVIITIIIFTIIIIASEANFLVRSMARNFTIIYIYISG